jgi:hypothetical protein
MQPSGYKLLFNSKDFHLSKAMVGNKLPSRQCVSLFLEFSGLGNLKALFNIDKSEFNNVPM